MADGHNIPGKQHYSPTDNFAAETPANNNYIYNKLLFRLAGKAKKGFHAVLSKVVSS